ncbi:MAG TPA: hypothetical protein VG186_11330 [Solirubrobacteraceae bacterium]|nr:hypothetical protein [Solirubrobacteraceae bacterium]
MSIRRLATLAVLAALAALAVPSAVAAQVPATAPHIRLAGAFTMTGRITAAHGVTGERVGERVTRTWTFEPTCPVGQCLTEELVRARGVGTDRTLLRRKFTVFSRWRGEGSYFAPLMCGARVHPLGERVFFRITVEITAAAPGADGLPAATSVRATYVSYRHTNRTRCVLPAARDAAVYTGVPVTPAPGQPAPTPAPG